MKSRLLFAIELISRDVIFELLEIVENAVEERNWKDKFSMSKTKEGKGVIMW